jgi:ABC-type nitrate/sulfonate/bicarbonate transport systems, periplasmic components
MKKVTLTKILTYVCIACLSFSLIGCGNEAKSPTPKVEPLKTLRITYVKSPLNIPSIVDKNLETVKKSFAKDNITVTFPDINSGAKQTEALAAGSLDICSALGGTSAILAASNGVDIKIIGIYSRAPKAFNIMAKDPSIKSAADLKGKKIAGPKGTILHQILIAALDKNGLSGTDVELISMDIPASVTAMLNGNVDVALVAGADVLRAEKAGAHIVANGEGLVDATIVIATSGKFLKEHPDAIKQFLAAHNENIEYMNKNKESAFAYTAAETGLQPSDVKIMAPWYNFGPNISAKDIEELVKTQDFLLKTNLQKNKININNLIVKL